MPRRPPDDPWDDLLSQLEASLDELDYPEGAAREAVLAGVRDALEDLLVDAPEPQGPPVVEVVEGGLDEDSPRSAGERPDLRVAEAPEPGRPSVTLLRLPPRSGAALEEEGIIRLRAPESQQRIYFGPEHPQTYRLSCQKGSFSVVVDGEEPFRLEAGQTADADGAVITVGEAEEGGAQGAYVRLR